MHASSVEVCLIGSLYYMYLITSVYINNIVLCGVFTLLEIRITFNFLYKDRQFLKVKQMVNNIKNLITVCFE